MYYPEFIFQASSRHLIKLAVLAMVPPGVKLTHFIYLKLISDQRVAKAVNVVFAAGVCLLILAAPVAFYQGDYQDNTLVRIAAEIDYEHRLKNASLNIDEENFFGALASESDASYPSHANPADRSAMANVIIFVIETAPDRYYPDLVDYFKKTGRHDLAALTLRFGEHYSTYPQSDRAIYSMLSGNYPPLDKGDEWIDVPAVYNHSLLSVLKENGYQTYLLSTAPLNFHNNLAMFEGLGFDSLEEMEKTKTARQNSDGTTGWNRPLLYPADEELLEKTLKFVDEQAGNTKNPFFLMLTPQASHAPFQRPPGFEQEKADDVDLLKANAFWQFNLMVQIFDRLKQTGLLANSLVIVTGDHGIRNRYESRELLNNQHILDAVCFKVPLWIIKGRDTKPFAGPEHATSHIDLAPTILDWLGLPFDPANYHGRSVFTQPDRSLFFLGGNILPVSGFKEDDCYFMQNRYLSIYQANSEFDFEQTPKSLSHKKAYPADKCRELPNLKSKIAWEMRQIKYILVTQTQTN